MSDAYARAGVDTGEARGGVNALVSALARIDTGRASRSIVPSGHYASVLALDELTAVAICTDGVGTKLIIAEAMNRFDTVGIDCVAMNVNDLVCVGAEPIALVDYVAVEQADEAMLAALGEGLREGATQAAVEIPGGELAQVPEMLRGHPSPRGVDLVGTAIGVVQRDRIVTGERIAPGDLVIGVPSSGLHSNGYSLARRALREQGGYGLDDAPPELGRSLADELLEPTAIYVRAALDLLRSDVQVHGLAHITGDGLLNLLRLNPDVGYHVDVPLEPQPVFELIQRSGNVPDAEMWEVFNMGTGFCAVVDGGDAPATAELLAKHHPRARVIGEVTDSAGVVRLPTMGLIGDKSGFRHASL
jgi:phosphoribosylformylglycinamidine cyclo-ligase